MIADKADKKAEIEKTERQIQQQQEREDEMRELALKLRKRLVNRVNKYEVLSINLFLLQASRATS